jgi:hypothetical protein
LLETKRRELSDEIQTKVDTLVRRIQDHGKSLQKELNILVDDRLLSMQKTSDFSREVCATVHSKVEHLRRRIQALTPVQLLDESPSIAGSIDSLIVENFSAKIAINDLRLTDGTYRKTLESLEYCLYIESDFTADTEKSTITKLVSKSSLYNKIQFIVSLVNVNGKLLSQSSANFHFKVEILPDIRKTIQKENSMSSFPSNIKTEISEGSDGLYYISFPLPEVSTLVACYIVASATVSGRHLKNSPYSIYGPSMIAGSERILFGCVGDRMSGRVLSVSSEFRENDSSYKSENIMSLSKSSAWVAKTCAAEYIELELDSSLPDGSLGVCILDRIELFNLNARLYKLSVHIPEESQENLSMRVSESPSGKKINPRKSVKPLKWIPLDSTPVFVPTSGDSSKWTVRIGENNGAKFEGVTAVRLDIMGNANMAAFYGVNVYGWVKAPSIKIDSYSE